MLIKTHDGDYANLNGHHILKSETFSAGGGKVFTVYISKEVANGEDYSSDEMEIANECSNEEANKIRDRIVADYAAGQRVCNPFRDNVLLKSEKEELEVIERYLVSQLPEKAKSYYKEWKSDPVANFEDWLLQTNDGISDNEVLRQIVESGIAKALDNLHWIEGRYWMLTHKTTN